MRRGVRVAVDVGTSRVGIARSDPDGLVATPLETLAATDDPATSVPGIARIVGDLAVLEVLVGLPRSLSGRAGASAAAARNASPIAFGSA